MNKYGDGVQHFIPLLLISQLLMSRNGGGDDEGEDGSGLIPGWRVWVSVWSLEELLKRIE